MAKLVDRIEEDTFSSPACELESAKMRRFLGISEIIRADISALQTVWRRERDSNPRYRFDTQSLDVSVSCRLQNTPREFHAKTDADCLRTVRFRFALHSQGAGERQAILWQKMVTPLGAWQPDWASCDCVPSGPSQDRKFLRRKELFEARVS